MPHRSRVYKTQNLIKIYLDLESYKLDFCWAKFYKTQIRISKSLNTLSPITLSLTLLSNSLPHSHFSHHIASLYHYSSLLTNLHLR